MADHCIRHSYQFPVTGPQACGALWDILVCVELFLALNLMGVFSVSCSQYPRKRKPFHWLITQNAQTKYVLQLYNAGATLVPRSYSSCPMSRLKLIEKTRFSFCVGHQGTGIVPGSEGLSGNGGVLVPAVFLCSFFWLID